MIQRCEDHPEYCPVEECLKFLAGAWTPQILWQLRVGPKRFGELRRALPGISAKVLTTRLRELEERDMIARAVKPSSPPAVEYKLIELGFEIQPVLDAIAEVGHKLHARLSDKRARVQQAVQQSIQQSVQPEPLQSTTLQPTASQQPSA